MVLCIKTSTRVLEGRFLVNRVTNIILGHQEHQFIHVLSTLFIEWNIQKHLKEKYVKQFIIDELSVDRITDNMCMIMNVP